MLTIDMLKKNVSSQLLLFFWFITLFAYTFGAEFIPLWWIIMYITSKREYMSQLFM